MLDQLRCVFFLQCVQNVPVEVVQPYGRWVLQGPKEPPPVPAARCRLFCFPQAGMGAWAFHGWQAALQDALPELEVMPVELPGRGPIGANCMANSRDFKAPVAAYECLLKDIATLRRLSFLATLVSVYPCGALAASV